MKNLRLMLKTIGLVGLVTILVSAGYAQNREKFGISAKAGGVNAVTGTVMVTRTGQTPQLLTDRDDLVSGDVVTTGAASQTEVLLNPGSYLRVAPNSEFVLIDNSLNNLVVKLVKGSAIVEASGGDYADVRINVLANQQSLMVISGGIYRFNVQPGATDLLVRKGRVMPGNGNREVLKGGTRITYAAGAPLVAKLDKKDQDDFDLWSKERAKTLVQANLKISARTFNGYLASMSALDWSFPAASSWGVWTYSPFSRCYTFMPFRPGLSSAYGNSYGNYYFYWPNRGYISNTVIVSGQPTSGGSPSVVGGSTPGGYPSSGPGPSGSTGSPSSVGPSAPSSPSQAGPRDPDSGSRSINRIKDPNN
jgi:hypothetical protein